MRIIMSQHNAFPYQFDPELLKIDPQLTSRFASAGLTKRELFAAMAMQSLITLPGLQELDANEVAMTALKYADALIDELKESK